MRCLFNDHDSRECERSSMNDRLECVSYITFNIAYKTKTTASASSTGEEDSVVKRTSEQETAERNRIKRRRRSGGTRNR